MPTTRYTVFDGEIVSESRAGVLHDYVSDPLGNTVALLDDTQTQTDQWAYFPYGESVRVKGTTSTPMLFVGNKSCRQDSSAIRSYMQYRFLDMVKARWMTEEPIGPRDGDLNLYPYVANRPVTITDPSGLFSCWWCLLAGFGGPETEILCQIFCRIKRHKVQLGGCLDFELRDCELTCASLGMRVRQCLHREFGPPLCLCEYCG